MKTAYIVVDMNSNAHGYLKYCAKEGALKEIEIADDADPLYKAERCEYNDGSGQGFTRYVPVSIPVQESKYIQFDKDGLIRECPLPQENGVKWDKSDCGSITPVIYKDGNLLNIRCEGYHCSIPYPIQNRTIDQEAEEAWEECWKEFSRCLPWTDASKEAFKEGFKAAKEGAVE